MVDLHTHILFGIDDGANTLEDSLALIDMEIEHGVSTVICTPHYNPLNQDLDEFITLRDENFTTLKQAITDSKRPITILKGAEIYYSSMLLEMDLNDLVIENTNYLLIELSTRSMPSNLLGQLSELQVMGYIPIIAHIEQYGYFRESPQLVIDLIHQGVLMQVNASSFFDKSQANFVKACIKHNWIHVVATDTHSIDKRPPRLSEVVQLLQINNSQIADYYLHNSQLILKNSIIQELPPSKIKKFLGKYM